MIIVGQTEREKILLQLGNIIGYMKKANQPISPFFGLGRIGIEIEKDDAGYHLYVDPQGGEYHEEGKYETFDLLVKKVTDLAYEEIDKIKE